MGAQHQHARAKQATVEVLEGPRRACRLSSAVVLGTLANARATSWHSGGVNPSTPFPSVTVVIRGRAAVSRRCHVAVPGTSAAAADITASSATCPVGRGSLGGGASFY